MSIHAQRTESAGHDRAENSARSADKANMPWLPVQVWDLPTRLFHWLLVVLVAAAYVTWRANWMSWHTLCGDAVLALILFRLIWGIVGSDTARFSQFMATPGAAIAHLTHFFQREPDRQCGHNPAGGWMVLALLLLLLGQAVSGIIINNDVADEGPLTELMPVWLANLITDLHVYLWDMLLLAIGLHVAVIFIYVLLKKQNLLRPMITGTKLLPAVQAPPYIRPAMLALLVFGITAIVTALIANFV